MKATIVFVINSISGGGAESVVRLVSKEFGRLGSNVFVFTLQDRPYDKIPNVTIIPYERRFSDKLFPLRIVHWVYWLKQQISSLPNMVLCTSHLLVPNLVCKAANIKNLWMVLHTTVSRFKGLQRFLFRWVLKNSNVACVSEGVANDLDEVFHGETKAVKVLYNPYVPSRVVRHSLDPPVPVPFIVSVGRLERVKRHDVLLKAFVQVPEPYSLIILGDGSQREAIEETIKNLGLQRRVVMLGWIDDPAPYIQEAKLLVLSSDNEGLPMVLVEALSLGTPVVSTDCNNGPREILTGAFSKFLSRVGDPEDLANKIGMALKSYPAITEKAVSKFSLESVIQNYQSLMEHE